MKKKILALLLVVSMIIVLASCTAAHGMSSVTITSKEGAGTKTLVMSIPKYNDNGVLDEHQEQFFPQGFEPVREWLEEHYGYEVTFEEFDDCWDYTMTFSFTDIDDYNAKMKDLMTEEYWLDLAEEDMAELTVEEVDGGYNVTLKESVFANKAAIAGIMSQLREQKDIFDYQYGTGNDDNKPAPDSHEDFIKCEVTVGDKTEVLAVDHPTEKSLTDESMNPERFFEVTGFVSADADTEPPASEETPKDEDEKESPKTGDYIIGPFVVLLLSSGLIIKSRKMMIKSN